MFRIPYADINNKHKDSHWSAFCFYFYDKLHAIVKSLEILAMFFKLQSVEQLSLSASSKYLRFV